ncbi:hypothetical protein GXM_04026 [Nostoc sphaeroides CCNUC1]|uniref:Uncharacterized protein n=1 Tax=Nostoc sphaeroides CCNUC1 TaxID=2653204 RepID=A0A5P8W1F0_9NOSO|nr:hypothetical protein GXM_04026 [Nostoc sphaeroides CCNUC1]
MSIGHWGLVIRNWALGIGNFSIRYALFLSLLITNNAKSG